MTPLSNLTLAACSSGAFSVAIRLPLVSLEKIVQSSVSTRVVGSCFLDLRRGWGGGEEVGGGEGFPSLGVPFSLPPLHSVWEVTNYKEVKLSQPDLRGGTGLRDFTDSGLGVALGGRGEVGSKLPTGTCERVPTDFGQQGALSSRVSG